MNTMRTCPQCGYRVDSESRVYGEGRDTGYKAGDVSICLYCSAVNIFTADGLLRVPDAAELDETNVQNALTRWLVFRAAGKIPQGRKP